MGINNFHKWVDATLGARKGVPRRLRGRKRRGGYEFASRPRCMAPQSEHAGASPQAHPQAARRVVGRAAAADASPPTVRASTPSTQTWLALFSDGPLLWPSSPPKERGGSAAGPRRARDGYDEDVVDEAKFTTLMISPGTAFSRALAERLDAWAAKRLAKGRGFRGSCCPTRPSPARARSSTRTLIKVRHVVMYAGDADGHGASRCPVWKSTSASGAPRSAHKSFGDDAAVLARSSGEEPASPRHRRRRVRVATRTTTW